MPKPIEVTAEQAAESSRRVADEEAFLLRIIEARNRNRGEELPSPTASPPSDSPQQRAAEENESGSGSDGTQTHTANLEEVPSPPNSLPPPLFPGKTTASPPSDSPQQRAAEENESGSGSDGTQTHTANLFSWPGDNEERATGIDTIIIAFDNTIRSFEREFERRLERRLARGKKKKILSEFDQTIRSLKRLGLVLTKSDSEFQLARTGRVDINTASLNDELMGRIGSDFFMTLLNVLQFHPHARELPRFEKGMISFPSPIFNSLKNENVTKALDRISDMGIDVFEYGCLQFAIDYEDNRSLFVVTSCARVVQTYFDPNDERRAGHPTTGAIHLDSSRKHPTNMIKELIANLLNEAWLRKHGDDEYKSEGDEKRRPFNRLFVATPSVPQQTEGYSTMYTCLFALKMFQTRDQPYYDHDYESNCRLRVTESFKFGHEDALMLNREMKGCILMLQSRSEKRVNQVHAIVKKSSVAPSSPRLCLKGREEDGRAAPSSKPESTDESVVSAPSSKPESTTSHRKCSLSEKVWAKKKEADRKSAERRYKRLRDKVIPELQQSGHVLPKHQQREIKYWKGDCNGTFAEARQLTMPAKITTIINKRKKVTIDGIIVQKFGIPKWNLFAIEESRIQVHKTVYYDSFIATQMTGWMQFEQESVPVAVVRCNNETKIVTQSSISDVAPCQMRKNNAPDRLTSDSVGKLTWKESSSSKKKKSVATSCPDQHFHQCYKESFKQQDGSLCASDPKVQRMLSEGKVDQAVSESLWLKGRKRDSLGKPVGTASNQTKRAFAAVKADPDAQKRLKATVIFESLNRTRKLDMEPTLPTGAPPPRPSRRLPTRSNVKKTSTKSENKKRPSSPPLATAPKRPKQPQTQCGHDGCNNFAMRMYYPFCNAHKTNVKMCSKCHERESRRRGGLCRKCFGKCFSEEELKEAKRCCECKVRFSRQIGGRCNECVLDGPKTSK